MKTNPIQIGAALVAALLIITTASSNAAVATVDLAGAVVASGSSINRDSGATVVSATTSYTYSVSGTISGTAGLAALPSMSLASFVTLLGGNSAELSGTYANVGGTLPVGVLFSKTYAGSFLGGTVSGSMTFSGAINGGGVVSVAVNNIGFTPNIGTIVFSSGSGIVSDGAVALVYQPDGIVSSGTTITVGADVYSPTAQKLAQKVKRGVTKSRIYDYVIQNDGTGVDSFSIKGKKGKLGFKVQYFDGITDVTTLVTSGSFQTAALPVGDSKALSVTVTNKNAAPGTLLNIAITATSGANSTENDKVTIAATAK